MRNNIAGMIFHPPSMNILDEAVLEFFPFVKKIYEKIPLVKKKEMLLKIPSFKYFYIPDIISAVGKRVGLYGFMLPMLPEQMVTGKKEMVIKKILNLIDKAQKLGVRIITLGSFSSVVTDQGRDLEKHTSIAITSGNSYTSSLCINAIFNLCKKLEIDLKDISIGVIGATGDIGSICAKIFSREVGRLVLCSRTIKEHDKTVLEIRNNSVAKVVVCDDPKKAVADVDIIICATSAFTTLFCSEDIPSGCIVCDLSMPPNVAKNILSDRNDVIAFEGGRAKMPGFHDINNRVWKNLFPYNSIYGCLAESLILALEGRYENYSIGRGALSEKKVAEIYDLGKKYGFDVADFSCFGYFYKEEDFDRFRQIRRVSEKYGK